MSPDFGSLDAAVRSEGIRGVMGDSKDFWLFFKRNDCTIYENLRMFASVKLIFISLLFTW